MTGTDIAVIGHFIAVCIYGIIKPRANITTVRHSICIPILSVVETVTNIIHITNPIVVSVGTLGKKKGDGARRGDCRDKLVGA